MKIRSDRGRQYTLGKKFTLIVYHNCKHRDKFMQLTRDRFFGTGILLILFLKH